jgi:hypothetical protein
MDSKIFIFLVLLASACVSVESAGYNYASYWNYGGSNSQLFLANPTANPLIAAILYFQGGTLPLTVTDVFPAGGGTPWVAHLYQALASGYLGYSIHIQSGGATLLANQYLVVDACFSGQTDDAAALYMAIEVLASGFAAQIGPYSREKFEDSKQRSVCAMFLVENKYLKDGADILFAALTTDTTTILTQAKFSLRITSHYTSVATLTGGTYSTLLRIQATIDVKRPFREIGYNNPGITTTNIFPSGIPWTVSQVANIPNGGYNAIQVQITSAGASMLLSDQYLEVDYVVSGWNIGNGGDYLLSAFVSIIGTGGSFNSTLCNVYFDDSDYRRMYIPFIIPSQYLTANAIIRVYGNTGQTDATGTILTTSDFSGASLMLSSHHLTY